VPPYRSPLTRKVIDMTRFPEARFAIALLAALVNLSCMAPVRSTGSMETGWHAMQPIRASVLLLIPEELDGLVYTHSHRGGSVTIPLGRQAADQLDRLLGSAFTSSSIMLVESESVARDRISREDPELRPYDYVALPRFMNVTSWDKGFEHGFDVDVVLEISSFDTGRVDIIRGHGESKAPAQAGSTPEQSARIALSYAMDAVKDGLETRREALSR
jgi:hypothetical protein